MKSTIGKTEFEWARREVADNAGRMHPKYELDTPAGFAGIHDLRELEGGCWVYVLLSRPGSQPATTGTLEEAKEYAEKQLNEEWHRHRKDLLDPGYQDFYDVDVTARSVRRFPIDETGEVT